MDNDPITATPPSQRKCHDNRVLPSPAALRHESALPEVRSTKGAIDQMTDHPSRAPLRSITKPARSSAASNKGGEAESHLYMLPSRKARHCQSMTIRKFVLISLEIKKQLNKKD